MDYAKESLRLHKEWKGKIEVVTRVPAENKEDLSLAYTPGEHAYIGDGKIGPVTQKLYDTMTGMQWGKIPDTKGWIVPVEKKY